MLLVNGGSTATSEGQVIPSPSLPHESSSPLSLPTSSLSPCY